MAITKKHKTSTAYGVFILESLREDDFKDGERLGAILKIALINFLYKPVANKSEFVQAISEFNKSGYRYLHVSCHADLDSIEIGGEVIDYSELKSILKGDITGRRVFFSACEASNLKSATVIINKCNGLSVVGPPVKVDEDKAALFWPSFYYAINRIDSESMKRKGLRNTLQRCVDLFDAPINFYARSKIREHMKRYKIRARKTMDSKSVQIAR